MPTPMQIRGSAVIADHNISQSKDEPQKLDPNLQVPLSNRSLIHLHCDDKEIVALVDTGAQINLVDRNLLRAINPKLITKLDFKRMTCTGLGQSKTEALGYVEIPIQFGEHEVHIKAYVISNCMYPIIIGQPFCKAHHANINWDKKTFELQKTIPIFAKTNVVLKAQEQVFVLARTTHIVPYGAHYSTEPSLVPGKFPCMLSRTMLVGKQSDTIPCTILNPLEKDVLLKKNEIIGFANYEDIPIIKTDWSRRVAKDPQMEVMSLAKEHQKIDSTNLEPIVPTEINNPNLTLTQRQALLTVLRKNKHVFSDASGAPGHTKLIKARFRLKPGVTPKHIPYRMKNPKYEEFIEAEIQRMLDAGIIAISDDIMTEHSWTSRIVAVPRKGATNADPRLRICIDFRLLNEALLPYYDVVPNVSDTLNMVLKNKPRWYSALDVRQGYYSIELDRTSQNLTGFLGRRHRYVHKRLPMGARPAAFFFQQLMHKILKEYLYEFACCYIDDIIIFSSNFEEHLIHIDKILKALTVAGLKIQASKCYFAQRQIHYLGHILENQCIKPDERKVTTIRNYPKPKTKKQLRSFLGLIGYYRKFIPRHAEIAESLYKLAQDKAEWKWTEIEEKAFKTLKSQLAESTMLHAIDFEKEFTVATDASGLAASAILMQKDDEGALYPIWFLSRVFNERECKLGATRRELLAVIYAIESFHDFLYGKKWHLITDCLALVTINKAEKLSPVISRAIMKLQGYHFDITHLAGKLNVAADALSRVAIPENCPYKPPEITEVYSVNTNKVTRTDEEIENDVLIAERINCLFSTEKEVLQTIENIDHIPKVIDPFYKTKDTNLEIWDKVLDRADWNVDTMYSILEDSEVMPITEKEAKTANDLLNKHNPEYTYNLLEMSQEEIAEAQRESKDLAAIIDYLQGKDISELPHKVYKAAITLANDCLLHNGLLYRIDPRKKEHKLQQTKPQLCLPPKMQVPAMKRLHIANNHTGINDLVISTRKHFWFPRYTILAQQVVLACPICQQYRATKIGLRGTVGKKEIAYQPFTMVQLDLLTMSEEELAISQEKYRYICLVVCEYSRYCIAWPQKTKEATEVINGFYEHVILPYSTPLVIHTDKGGEFTSKLNEAYNATFGIRHRTGAPFYHQSQGQVERQNQNLLKLLRPLCGPNKHSWPDKLNQVLAIMNNMQHEATGNLTPHFMIHGWHRRHPFDAFLQVPDLSNLAKSRREMLQNMMNNHNAAQKLSIKAGEKVFKKIQEQMKKGTVEHHYKIGDLCKYYVTKIHKGKGIHKIMPKWIGPYTVEAINGHNLKLKDATTGQFLQNEVNVRLTRHYYDQVEFDQSPISTEELPNEVLEEINIPPYTNFEYVRSADEAQTDQPNEQDWVHLQRQGSIWFNKLTDVQRNRFVKDSKTLHRIISMEAPNRNIDIDPDGYCPLVQLARSMTSANPSWLQAIAENDPSKRFQVKIEPRGPAIKVTSGYRYPLLGDCEKVDLHSLSSADTNIMLGVDLKSAYQIANLGGVLQRRYNIVYTGNPRRWNCVIPVIPDEVMALIKMKTEQLAADKCELFKDSHGCYVLISHNTELKLKPANVDQIIYRKNTPLVRTSAKVSLPVRDVLSDGGKTARGKTYKAIYPDGTYSYVTLGALNEAAKQIIHSQNTENEEIVDKDSSNNEPLERQTKSKHNLRPAKRK
jgi:RNA:NAD 2'-phosphotransferase (TPT1/KptA family)/transposase InsO family protein